MSSPSDVKAVPFTRTVCCGRVPFRGLGVVVVDTVVVVNNGVVVILEASIGRKAYPEAVFASNR